MKKDSRTPCVHHNGTHSCVSQVPIFNHLDQMHMNEIMSMTRSISFKKGEHIYHAGDESDSLYIVNKGRIRIYRLSDSVKNS